MKKGLLISGGGSWGAYAAGTLAALDNEYDIVAGNSTGALISPLAALRSWDKLQEGYTSQKADNIFDKHFLRPFPLKKDGGINVWAIIYALLFKKNALGTNFVLRETVKEFFSEGDYLALKNSNKEVIVGSQNLQSKPSKQQYFKLSESTYEDFLDWMWMSSTIPLIGSPHIKSWNKSGNTFIGTWVDGGTTELVPLKPLIECGCEEIDIMIIKPKPIMNDSVENFKIPRLIDHVDDVIRAMRHDIEYEFFNHLVKKHSSKTKIKIWYLPKNPEHPSTYFDPNTMKKWYIEGYNTANDSYRIEIV